MHKLKTLIRNVRKGYRTDFANFDWTAELDPRNPRKQWEPDATTINFTHSITIHPNRYLRSATMCIRGYNYFK